MPINNSNGMSPELIKDLAKALEEADKLMKEQEKALARILDTESQIMSKRAESLDKYTEGLNNLTKQYKKDIDGYFSALENRLTALYKKIPSDRSTDDLPTTRGKKQNDSSGTSTRGVSKTVTEIRNILKSGTLNVSDAKQQNLLTELITEIKILTGSSTSSFVSKPTNTTSYLGNTESSTVKPVVNTTKQPSTDKQSADTSGISEYVETSRKTYLEEMLKAQDELNNAKIGSLENEILLERQLRGEMLEELSEDELALIKKAADLSSQFKEEALQKERNNLKELRELKQKAAFDSSDEGVAFKVAEAGRLADLELEKKKAELRKKEDDKVFAWRAQQEAALQVKQGKLTAEQYAEQLAILDQETEKRFKKNEKKAAKALENENKKDKEKTRLENRGELKSLLTTPLGAGDGLIERFAALKEHNANKITADENGNVSKSAKAVAALDSAAAAISDLAKQLENTVDAIGSFKGAIDTRLQGSKNDKRMGSYWDQLIVDMTSVGAVTPFFKQETFANNIKSLVDQGISFDLKQRAFLMTIQEKIATTFNVADGTLLRLIRIQQQDTTAGRLGMESALNSFLNEMYENTEYLKTVAEGVRSSLAEMEALMSGTMATEVEFQVQKWMGSLYSVGMSQEAVQGIAGALGQIAAGQIDGLTGGTGAGNLLVMAANKSGKSIAEILSSGLDADETNNLLQAAVNYLADIAQSTDSRVVQQQIAGVFGVKASDLKAAVNLRDDPKDHKNSITDIASTNFNYDNMLNQLFSMAGSMYARTSIAEMMSNVWANGQYTLAGSMANNPISYLTYKVASLVDSVAGGIALPDIKVMGSGVNLQTTVADLMRVAAMTGGVFSSLGQMVAGLGNSFSGKAMLTKLGIEEGKELEFNIRGGKGVGATPTPEGNNLSESGFIGNGDGSNIKDSTMQAADDEKKKQMIKAKEEEPTNHVDMINSSVLKIYEILDDVAKGSKTLRVRVDNYGLTGNNKLNNSQGGVNGLAGNDTSLLNDASIANGSTGSVSSGSSSNSASSSQSVTSLGGWIVT